MGEIDKAGATSASRMCFVVIEGPIDWKRGLTSSSVRQHGWPPATGAGTFAKS